MASMLTGAILRELRLYAGLPLFVFIVLVGSVASLFLFLVSYYVLIKGRALSATPVFVREGLVKFRWLVWLFITTDVFLISNHLLLRGLAVGIWDVDGYFYPYYVLVADYARAGRFVRWNPWSNGGVPILGDPTLGIFSPINFVIGLLIGGRSSGFIFYWLFIWWLGAFGMFMLARHLKAPAWGACAVALGFLFCGAYTGNAEHTPWITSFSFLPLIIWRFDYALSFHKLRPAVEAGAFWGLSALAGYPGLTIVTGCFAALWGIGRWLFSGPSAAASTPDVGNPALQTRQQSRLSVLVSALVLVLLVGVVVLSPAYVAFFVEGAGTHERVDALNREWAILRNALHPGALSTFASPYLVILKLYDQMSGTNKLWPYTDVSSASIYAGAIIPVLALFALLKQPRDGWRWWLLGLGALSLACTLGQALPLRGWLYDWFYPMRFFRNAAIFRFYYLFAVSVLALIATRDLEIAIRNPADRMWKQFLVATVCLASAALIVFVGFSDSAFVNQKTIVLLGSIHALWVWVGLCCLVYASLKLRTRLNSYALPLLMVSFTASDAFLTSTLSAQTMINTRPDYVQRWKSLDAEHSAVLDLTRSGLFRGEASCYPNPPCKDLNNDQLITKIPVLSSYVDYNTFHWEAANHAILKMTALGAERTWFSKTVGQVAPTPGNFRAFMRRTEALGEPPVVVHSPRELLLLGIPPTENLLRPIKTDAAREANADQIAQIERLPAAERIAVNLLKYLPDELVLTVQSPTDGWLLVTDRWARSWRAEVNGREAAVYGGNFIFRAVQVSAGHNYIKFTYHPFGFPFFVIASWGTLAVVGIYSVYSGLKSRPV
jgi:hypothetical protein